MTRVRRKKNSKHFTTQKKRTWSSKTNRDAVGERKQTNILTYYDMFIEKNPITI